MDGNSMFYGGGFMWIFWVILLVVLVFIVKGVAGNNPGSGVPNSESPLDILKKRYARGEIDEQEFERRRHDLE